MVTTHYTLDKQNASTREYLAERADFLGAIRLPSDAFKREGTSVVTDIVFLRKRPPGQAAGHADPAWLEVGTLRLEGVDVAINRYFLGHPEMVLGVWSRKDRLYGGEDGYSVTSKRGALRAAPGRRRPAARDDSHAFGHRPQGAGRFLHPAPCPRPRHRGELLRRSGPGHLPILGRGVGPRDLRRDHAQDRRDDDGETARPS